MLIIDSGKIYFNNKEISNELFALMFKDASDNMAVEIDLKRLTINKKKLV